MRMKFKLILAAIAAASFIGVGANAAVGDVAGNIYTTDIFCYNDGTEIKRKG